MERRKRTSRRTGSQVRRSLAIGAREHHRISLRPSFHGCEYQRHSASRRLAKKQHQGGTLFYSGQEHCTLPQSRFVQATPWSLAGLIYKGSMGKSILAARPPALPLPLDSVFGRLSKGRIRKRWIAHAPAEHP